MKKTSECDYEHTVVKSLKSGSLNEDLTGHIKSCANCREVAKVVGFFQTNLAKESKPKKLPAAGLVWWKFRLREKQRAAEQISKPIFYVQTAAIILFIGVFIWLFSSGALQSTPFESGLNRISTSIEQIIVTLVTGIVTISLIGLIIIFTLRRFLLEK